MRALSISLPPRLLSSSNLALCRADWLSGGGAKPLISEIEAALEGAGIIQDLLACLTKHGGSDSAVNESAAGFAQSFISSAGGVSRKTAIIDAGLVPLFAAAVSTYPEDEDIADLVCTTLHKLAMERSLAQRVADSGALDVATAVSARFPPDSEAGKSAVGLKRCLEAARIRS